jgi:radical SAM superfamily enzyme YgiQ (UPF0313 family)
LIHPRGAFVAKNRHMAAFMAAHRREFRPWLIPNLGLLTIAALTPPELDLEYVDENVDPVDLDREYDVVALSGMTQQAFRAYELAVEFRARGVHTVMGGAHATVMADEAAGYVDTVISGEAESVWEEFLSDYRAGRPRRRYGNLALASVDLTGSPTPRYDLLGPGFFQRGWGYRMIPVQTSRGCPRMCDFCSVPQVYGNAFRTKTVAQVVRDVEAATRAAPGTLVLFADDNMFINRRFARELLSALIPLRIRYMAQSDIGIARDPGLLRLIKASGCVMILVGLESLSEDTLKTVDAFKARMCGGYEAGVRRIQEHGIPVLGAFIVGFDDDTPQTFDRIAAFCRRTSVFPQATIATPLPRTGMTERLRREGRLPAEAYWDRCTYYDAIYEPRGMSATELEAGIAALHDRLFAPEAVRARRTYFKEILRGARNGQPGGGRHS